MEKIRGGYTGEWRRDSTGTKTGVLYSVLHIWSIQ